MGLICTSYIDLENEFLVLKQMRDDMSAKLVEHNNMSAHFEIEVDLLRTTFAKCIEEQVESLRNALCGTCDRLKFENEFLSKKCKSLIAKSFDSHDSCHSSVGVFKVASSQPELASSVHCESLDVSTCAYASDSSSIAIPKLVSSSVPKVIHVARVLLISLELIMLNQSSIAPFARKMGIPSSFAIAVSSTSDVCVPNFLESHIAFPMARVILNWAPS